MAHFTGDELAVVGIAGTLIGGMGGSWISSRSQKRSTDATLNAQRELAEQARQLDRADELDRESRAHKRDAYIVIITAMSKLEESLAPYRYFKAAPRLSATGDDERWWDYQIDRYNTVFESRALATTNGSDEMVQLLESLSATLGHLFRALDDDQATMTNSWLNGDIPASQDSTKAAMSSVVLTGFNDMTAPTRKLTRDVRKLARHEIGIARIEGQ